MKPFQEELEKILGEEFMFGPGSRLGNRAISRIIQAIDERIGPDLDEKQESLLGKDKIINVINRTTNDEKRRFRLILGIKEKSGDPQ